MNSGQKINWTEFTSKLPLGRDKEGVALRTKILPPKKRTRISSGVVCSSQS